MWIGAEQFYKFSLQWVCKDAPPLRLTQAHVQKKRRPAQRSSAQLPCVFYDRGANTAITIKLEREPAFYHYLHFHEDEYRRSYR
jgi:hypothetical protein